MVYSGYDYVSVLELNLTHFGKIAPIYFSYPWLTPIKPQFSFLYDF